MKAKSAQRRPPEVNLLTRTRRAVETSSRRRRHTFETVLIVLVLVIWAGVGVAMALLLGWHPPLGAGR